MANSAQILAICALLTLLSSSSAGVAASSGNHHQIGWFQSPEETECRGSMAECGTGVEEFEMDSEISRRILLQETQFISYGALTRNIVPCSRRGASYYNCRRGRRVNPYTRGCSAITRCRS